MQGKIKKITSMLLALTMMFGIITIAPFTVSATETGGSTASAADKVEPATESQEAAKQSSNEDTAATDAKEETVYRGIIADKSTLSQSVGAAEDTTESGGYITRAQWLSNLTEAFNMTVEEDNYPDNYFSDISSSDSYYRDIMVATEFGVIDIEAGEEVRPNDYATRDFCASTLNYCLGFKLDEGEEYTYEDYSVTAHPEDAQIAINRGWFTLADNLFNPDTSVTAEESTAMLADAGEIQSKSEVHSDYNNVFEFNENVVVIPQGTSVSKSDDIVTIYGSSVTVNEGDTFAVYIGEIPEVYIADKVEKNGAITTISVTEADFEESVKTADAEGTEEFVISDIEPAEGVEITYETEDDTSAETRSPRLRASSTKRLKSVNPKVTLTLGGVSVTVKCKLYNLSADYIIKNGTNRQYMVEINGEAEITTTTSVKNIISELGGQSTVNIMNYSIPGIGKVGVYLYISLSGEITLIYDTYFSAGFEYTSSSGFRTIKSFSKKSFSVTAEINSDIGIKASAEVNVMNVIRGSIWAKMGAKAKYTTKVFTDGEAPQNCTTFRAWFYADMGCNIGISALGFSKSYSKIITIYDENNSPARVYFHKEDGVQVARCSRGGCHYTTSGYSRYGYSGSGSSSGYNEAGEPITIFEYSPEGDNNATITKYYGNVSALAIPKTIDGYTVTGIGNSAFEGNTLLRVVTMPDTITSIGDSAFEGCTSLKTVNLSSSLQTIGRLAFAYTAIEAIEIPKSLDSCRYYSSTYSYTLNNETYSFMYAGPFFHCDEMKTITFENGVTEISEGLFAGCTGLEAVTIPSTVTTIEKSAFIDCLRLGSVKISDTVTRVNDSAFENCISLKTMNLPKALQTMGDFAFAYTAIEAIEIPKSLDSCDHYGSASSYTLNDETYSWMYAGPFFHCDELKTVTFENGVTEISECLFAGCTGLEAVTIPDTVTTIEQSAFRDCLRLSSVTIPDSVTSINDSAFQRCVSLKAVTIPDTVTRIDDSAFENCISLKTMNLPKALQTMGDFAFAYTAIEAIEIPKSLDSCDHYGSASSYTLNDETYSWMYAGPFFHCDELKTVTFENGVTEISECLFAGCTGLEAVTIPDAVTTIEKSAFRDCLRLSSVTIPDSVTSINSYAFQRCVSLTEATVPETVMSLGEYVFKDCSALQKAVLKNSPESIPAYTFENCASLTDFKLPDSVKSINKYAFNGCAALESIKLPEGLTDIADYAFCGCAALKEINVPDKVKSIGEYAFCSCSSLVTVNIPSRVKSIDRYAFQNCEMLENVNIADYSVKTINEATFKDCPSLKKITLPKGLTTVDNLAFANDTTFAEVTIPESVTSITANAFSYPTKMTAYGYTDSYAKTYCDEKGIKFIDNHILSQGICIDQSICDSEDYIVMDVGEVKEMKFEVYPLGSNDVITLTSDNNKVTIDGMHITSKSSGDSVITAVATSGLEYSFTIHTRAVKNITIKSLPDKTKYIQGEEFDSTGLAVQANYGDNSTEVVKDYTISGYNSDVVGIQTITVSYVGLNGSTYKADFEIEVADPRGKLTGISISKLPNKLNYVKFEALDTTGLVVVENYDSGISVEINDYTISGYNALKLGKQTITVKKGDYSATFDVMVFEKAVAIGDVNMDGVVDSADVIMLQDYLADKITFTEAQKALADINGDGEITEKDATELIIITGYEDPSGTTEPSSETTEPSSETEPSSSEQTEPSSSEITEPSSSEQTEPSSSESTPVAALTVNVTSNVFPADSEAYGEDVKYVTVDFNLDIELPLLSTMWTLNYDSTVLKLVSAEMPQIDKGALYNKDTIGEVIGTATNIDTYSISQDNPFISATFEVVGSGETTVDLFVDLLALGTQTDDDDSYVYVVDDGIVNSEVSLNCITAVSADVEPITTNPSEPTPDYKFGDVNLDGNVNVKDATLIQRMVVEEAGLTVTGVQRALADINGDGTISVKDATALQIIIVNT